MSATPTPTTLPGGLRVLNCTPHPITFACSACAGEGLIAWPYQSDTVDRPFALDSCAACGATGVVTVPPSGYTLPANAVEIEGECLACCRAESVSGHDYAGKDDPCPYLAAGFVRTVFEPSAQGRAELDEIKREHPGVLVVGSIISAQAYPGRVVAMTPAPGFERAAPADKRMNAAKFTTFA